ncbi:tektin 2 (testicular) [Chamberlinius hualienensis]
MKLSFLTTFTDLYIFTEFRIDHDRFWVKELEQRICLLKENEKRLIQAKCRLEKSISTCNWAVNITEKCLEVIKISDSKENANRIQLLNEEVKIFQETRSILSSIIMAIDDIDKCLTDIDKLLETNLQSKYIALNKDQQSLTLKLHSPQLPSLLSSAKQTCACPVNSKLKDLDGKNEQNLLKADQQLSSSNLFLLQMDDILSKMGEKVIDHVIKVNHALEQRLADLKNAKSNVEAHMSMVDSQISHTEDTIGHLQGAIATKQNAIALVECQLQLHRTRPKSELCVDQVAITLERQLADGKSELKALLGQFPILEKTLRSLRRSRLQISVDIQKQMKKIEWEELHCLNGRIGLDEIKF